MRGGLGRPSRRSRTLFKLSPTSNAMATAPASAATVKPYDAGSSLPTGQVLRRTLRSNSSQAYFLYVPEELAPNAPLFVTVHGISHNAEEHATLFVAPRGADLLELVTSLHGASEARFNQTFRLKDGSTKLSFDEEVIVRGTSTTSSKPGDLELPDIVMAGIAPFNGGPNYEVSARLKVRIENRRLVLWLETISPHKIIRDALVQIMREITEKTGIVPLIGIP